MSTYRVTLAGKSYMVVIDEIDDLNSEMPRIDDRFAGLPYRYGWYLANIGSKYPLMHDDELSRVHAITISHAHLDHSGYLPHIYSKKARPKIFLTKPTRDLMGVLLADYHRIHKSKDEQRLFTEKDVEDVMRDARIVEYGERFDADFRLTFHNAGHIMGSAMTMIEDHGVAARTERFPLAT